ncbi:sugar transporter-like [Holotrichia oblita]|uniref:Sugar transporter-like n=1 Tax=Holotrichia oblita TaxID=644536 RepID=A0ACB9SQB5_HOLOL|nr:sugar transporter-like [Holotrichia oblita]
MIFNLDNTRYMQYLCAITATISTAVVSTYSYWPSPALLALQSDESPIGRPITDEEGSWIVSLSRLAMIPSALLGGFVTEKIGRKYCMLIGGVFLLFPWFMLAFGKSIWVLYAARFIAGLAVGALVVCGTIYVGEVAENDIRGKLSTATIILRVSGSLMILCVGPYVSYQTLSLIGVILPILFLLSFSFMPESPFYLVKKNRIKEAEQNLRVLSSKTVDDKFIANRLNEIKYCIDEDMKNKATVWEFLSNPMYRKPMIILFGVKTLHQLSGESAISAYMQTIIGLTDSSVSEEISSIIFGAIQLPAALTAGFLIDKLGRKPLVIISAVGSAIALFTEGTFFYFQDVLEADLSSVAWLPTVALTLFLFMNPLGIIPLPYVLLGELFPTNIKGMAVSTITLYAGILTFLTARFFKPLSNAWGMYSTFWFFGSVCILGVIFVIVMLPETKRKSFSEIQALLHNKKGDDVENNKVVVDKPN